MNICLVINNDYVKIAKIFLTSLCENNRNISFNVYIIHSGLTKENINELEMLLDKYDSKLFPILIDDKIFDNAPKFWNTTSKETYFKLLIPEIIPKDVDKILYLDVDIIINGEIEGLYNTEFKEKLLAVREDYFVNRYEAIHKKELGLGEKNIYFNAGVMLFNLSKFRKVYDSQRIFKYIEENEKFIKYHDQDIFNGLFNSEIIIYGEEYNSFSKYKGIGDYIKYHLHIRGNKKVIHYAGLKPWNDRYFGKYYNLFWKYADLAGVELER